MPTTLTTPTYTDIGNTGPQGPQGPQGVKGDTGNTGSRGVAGPSGPLGPIGITPDIDVSSNTGAAGSSATVTKTGTAENPNFLFTIPRGDKGDTGTIEASYYLTPGEPMFTLDPSNGNTFINGTLDVSGNGTFNRDLTINGILRAGTLEVGSSEIAITDPILQLGSNNIDDDLNRGISFKYFEDSSKTGFFGYDQDDNTFVFRPVASDDATTGVFTGDYGTAKFGKVVVGNGTDPGIVESNGNENLVLQTGNTSTGTITIVDGTNSEIAIQPQGTGNINLTTAGNINLSTTGVGENSDINLSSAGTIELECSTVRTGKSNINAAITTWNASNLTLHTNDGDISGEITIANGASGDISLTPNGTGSVVISKADINGGTFDGTSVTASGAITGGSITDGTATLSSGALSSASSVTASGAISGGSASFGTSTPAAVSASGAVTITNTTSSSDKDTGALIVEGGVGIEENLYVGGTLNVDNIKIDGNSITATDTNGDIKIEPNGTGSVVVYNHFIPDTTGSVDLGTPSIKFRNIYGNISGTVTGAASQVVLTTKNDDITCYPTFAASASGDKELYADSGGTGLTYNPDSNTLTTGTFVGALNGTASSATTAGTVSSATQSAITSVSSGANGLTVAGTGALSATTLTSTVAVGTPPLSVTSTTEVANLRAATATTAGTCSGNALTATTLETARDIGGVSFDGSAAINLPGVNDNQTDATLTWAGNAANASNATTADRIQNGTPLSDNDTGTAGEIRYDANYIYVCIAANTWKRVGISAPF